MKPFEIISYNWDEQRLDFRINYPVKNGFLVIKDIDLETTIYKSPLWDVNPTLYLFTVPTPRHGFDFQSEDFGGFLFELVDEGRVIHKDMLRFRYTNLYKCKQDMKDFYHPVFMNYREFFVYDRYREFDLENCVTVLDAGGSVGLFTRYMLNKGAKQVVTVECDDRSIVALKTNFAQYPQVKIVEKALADTEGQIQLFWRDDNPLVNTVDLNSVEFNFENPNSKWVDSTTLLKIVEEQDWQTIDLIKIDIEGSEYAVIDSTPDSIFERVGKILLEYHWPNGRLEPIIDRFLSLGFKYKFEEGRSANDQNGTVFFYR